MKTCWNKTTSGLGPLVGSIVSTTCNFFVVIVTIVNPLKINTGCGEVLITDGVTGTSPC
jgi:hypothetical protein